MPCIDCPETSNAVLEPARDDAMRSHAECSVSELQRSNCSVLHDDASRSEREDWIHDFAPAAI